MLVIILYTFLSSVVSNASITVMPLSPRLVVGGNYVGDLTPCSNMPFGRGMCIIRGSTCTFLYLFSTDLMKEMVPVEGNQVITLFKSPITPYLLPTWEGEA